MTRKEMKRAKRAHKLSGRATLGKYREEVKNENS